MDKMAILGPMGTFSDLAYRKYIKDTGKNFEPLYCDSIDDVFESNTDFGIAPIENTLDGYVMRTLDMMLEKDINIIDENKIEVQFSLVSETESMDNIDVLYVQFKTYRQCIGFIKSLKNISIIMTESNMESYKKLKENPNSAAIVPKYVAKAFNFNLVINDVTDSKINHTRFVIFKKEPFEESMCLKNIGTEKIRIPIYVMPTLDRPGILYAILKSFFENRINLINLMSKPTKQELGVYNFYIEIEGLTDRIDVILRTLKEIQIYNDLKILGMY